MINLVSFFVAATTQQAPIAFHLEFVIAIIVLAGVLITAFASLAAAVFAFRGNKNASEINKAVNNRPKGDPTLYELVSSYGTSIKAHTEHMHVLREDLTEVKSDVKELKGWKTSYEDGPMESGKEARDFSTQTEKSFEEIKKLIKNSGCPVRLGQLEECLDKKD